MLKETEKTNGDDDDNDNDGNAKNKHIVQTLLIFNSRTTTISTNAPPPLFHFPNCIIFLDYKHARKLPRPGIGDTQYIGLDIRAIRHLALSVSS